MTRTPTPNRPVTPLRALALAALVALGACTTPQAEPEGAPRKETLHALTQGMELLTLNAGQPRKIDKRVAVTGLPAGDALVGLDYRVAKGVLYAVSRKGMVFTLNADTGLLTAVSAKPLEPSLEGDAFGVDFNPVADRIRVVSNTGQNLRFHPDTGALAMRDPALNFAPGDSQAAFPPEVVAAGYTYNKTNDKLTTNYAIDRRAGTLVTQGTVEGVQPAVSPNTGQLRTVGPLGTGPLLDATLDIADVSGAAFAAVRTATAPRTRLYLVNLSSGVAQLMGTVGDGAPLIGMAIAP
ncbi:MAG: hypothetical protein CFE44_15865 [Burkholderiales bacterium PBB4]|nr:MAG: hypothetical protein CFE44_15865 [Burkholderiales bacterium PBB4]